MLYWAVLYCTVLCYTVLYSTVLPWAVLRSTVALCATTSCCDGETEQQQGEAERGMFEARREEGSQEDSILASLSLRIASI